jgi:hypothetical protein
MACLASDGEGERSFARISYLVISKANNAAMHFDGAKGGVALRRAGNFDGNRLIDTQWRKKCVQEAT